MYVDILNNTYEVSQLAKRGKEQESEEGDHKDFERQQMSHTGAATDIKLMRTSYHT